MPDLRFKRCIRYPFSWLLAVCICAALSGDSSLRRIAECATRVVLGARKCAPAATTIQRVDPDALDEALATWAAARATGAVLAQIDVHAKTNEIPRLPVLLEEPDGHRSLKGRIFTVDALHTQTKTAHLICDTYRAHYMMTIKGNQPSLYAQPKAIPGTRSRSAMSRRTPATAGSCCGN